MFVIWHLFTQVGETRESMSEWHLFTQVGETRESMAALSESKNVAQAATGDFISAP